MRRREILSLFFALIGAVFLPLGLYLAVPQITGLPRLISVGEGMWQTKFPSLEKRVFSELKRPVDIAFDSNGIPHIIAKTEEDLYFAQGLLTAYYRLFEMDMTTRVAGGRLSELVGFPGLEYDRFFVSFGMKQAIRAETKKLLEDPDSGPMVTAYVKGVNAYIRSLRYKDLPLEYKLLNTWPQEWDESRVASLLKIMTFRLAGRNFTLGLSELIDKLGPEKVRQAFPEFMPANLEAYFIEPLGPRRRGNPPSLDLQNHIRDFPPFIRVMEGNGSNSWAVSPAKSKTGFSILANDTHLSYQLPAVWFEVQLLSPASNVYGGTFPGAPGVVLGFNPKLAWGVTNGTSDAIGWFEVEFKDDQSLDYRFDDGFKTAELENVPIAVKYQNPLMVPVLKTEYGYVLKREGKYGLAVRWTGDNASNEVKSIERLAQATSVDGCIEALKFWQNPVQNFSCADQNHIAIYHVGDLPIRKEGEGWTIEPAVGASSLWQKNIPFEEMPHAVDPESGFVFSANERPVGPSYPYYLNWNFEEPFRGQRIRNLLNEKRKFDAGDFIQMQSDVLDQHALLAMPIFIKQLKTDDLDETEITVMQAMKKWDYLAHAKSFESSVFNAWWKQVEQILWKDLYLSKTPVLPKKARTIWFFRQLESDPEKWKDWIQPYASGGDVITLAFKRAVADLKQRAGLDPQNWSWSDIQKTSLPHIAKIPGLGSDLLKMDGSAYSIMANRGNHGPTWKLIVEMGPKPRAWSQFPGGVTGNPLDPGYDKFVEPWSRGEMRHVDFWSNESEAMANAAYVWRWETR